jgi:hypothetical protein
MGTPSIHVNAVVELPLEYCDTFRKIAGSLITESDADPTLVGACAVHAGIGFMLRSYTPHEVAAWLEFEAHDLREFERQAAHRKARQAHSSAEVPKVGSSDALGG